MADNKTVYFYSPAGQKFVSAVGEGWPLKIAKNSLDEWTEFHIQYNVDGTISLYSPAGKKYVSAIGGGWPLKIAKDQVDEWCRFMPLSPNSLTD
jgi:hypothetical protein